MNWKSRQINQHGVKKLSLTEVATALRQFLRLNIQENIPMAPLCGQICLIVLSHNFIPMFFLKTDLKTIIPWNSHHGLIYLKTDFFNNANFHFKMNYKIAGCHFENMYLLWILHFSDFISALPPTLKWTFVYHFKVYKLSEWIS